MTGDGSVASELLRPSLLPSFPRDGKLIACLSPALHEIASSLAEETKQKQGENIRYRLRG